MLRNNGLVLTTAVFAILIFSAAWVVPRIVGGRSSPHEACQSEMTTIQGMLQHFHLDCHRYPTTEEGLEALHTCPQALAGLWGPDPYATKDVSVDPFGNPYLYSAEGASYTLQSLGEDDTEGGEGEAADLEVTD